MGGFSAVNPFTFLRPLQVSRVEAVELYPLASSLPSEAVGNACAAIIIWTR